MFSIKKKGGKYMGKQNEEEKITKYLHKFSITTEMWEIYFPERKTYC